MSHIMAPAESMLKAAISGADSYPEIFTVNYERKPTERRLISPSPCPLPLGEGESAPGQARVVYFCLAKAGLRVTILPVAGSWICLLLPVILQLSLDLSSNG